MPPGVEVADGVASGSASALADDPSAAVCTCMSVTQGEVCAAISALKLESVEDVGQHTRAGTGCGTCRPDIAALLRAHRSERQRAAA
jgi:assimilatory nitrate reductase catalytic subunit